MGPWWSAWCADDGFELDGGELAERPLAAAPVVGAFDPGDDREAGLVAGVPGLRSGTLVCSSEKNDSIAALSAS